MAGRSSLLRHLRRHPVDALFSVVVLVLMGWLVLSTLRWIWLAADWSVVSRNLPLFISGSYPGEERWRPQLWLGLLLRSLRSPCSCRCGERRVGFRSVCPGAGSA